MSWIYNQVETKEAPVRIIIIVTQCKKTEQAPLMTAFPTGWRCSKENEYARWTESRPTGEGRKRNGVVPNMRNTI